MVKSEIIEKQNCRVKLKVEIPAEEVTQEFEKVYKDFIRHATVPGFRKGKVPLTIIKARYKEAAKEEVLRQLISSSFQAAIKEKNLEVMTEPSVDEVDLKPEAPFLYKAVFEIRPEIKLGDYNKLKLTKKTKKITEKDVDASLKDIQERFAKYATVEGRDLAPGDYALADIKITEGGKEKANKEGIIIQIDDKAFGPGFEEKVKGLKKDEEREFSLKEMNFWIRLRDVKAKVTSPIDDELAKDVGMDSLEKLKEDIQKRLESFEAEKVRGELIKQIDERILSIGDLVPPESAVKKREELLLEEMRRDFDRQGKQDEYKTKEEELRKNAQESSLRAIKIAYLLDEVGKRENITVSEEKAEEELKKIFGDSKKDLKSIIPNYSLRLREQKIYQHIIDKADIKTEEE